MSKKSDKNDYVRPVDFSVGSDIVIQVENLWKRYRLGTINHGTLVQDLQSWWARRRGKEDPNLKVDQIAHLTEHVSLTGWETASSDFWALQAVSFDVRRGDTLGIIGKNGAGKSTMLKILSRVTTPTRGEIKMKGRVASLLEVGTGFHPELTGRENIFLNGAILGMNKHEIRGCLDEIIAFSEVEQFIDTPVKRYSSGMYVRLAFAVAAHLDPEILVVDEVLAVGDAQFQAKCIKKMKQVTSRGKTVLFVSHNMGVIGSLCNRAILINSGKIEHQGDTNEITGKYLSNFQGTNLEETSLKSRFEWLSEKTFVFESIKLSSNDSQIGGLPMGAPLKIDIDYSLKAKSHFLKIGIQIVDSLGTLVTNLSPNQQCPEFMGQIKNCGTMTCTINSLNLVPGHYSINLQAGIPGVDPLYSLDGASSFQVLEKDVFRTGIIPSKIHGLVYFPAEWSF